MLTDLHLNVQNLNWKVLSSLKMRSTMLFSGNWLTRKKQFQKLQSMVRFFFWLMTQDSASNEIMNVFELLT